MNDSSPPPLRELLATLIGAALLFALCCVELRWSATLQPWAPPATWIVGLGLAAGRGPLAGAALAGWAGLLHAAATAGSPGVAIAAAAIVSTALRIAFARPARRWALTGPLGWATAAGVAAVGGRLTGNGALFDWSPLPAAIALGLIAAGLAATVRSESLGAARGTW